MPSVSEQLLLALFRAALAEECPQRLSSERVPPPSRGRKAAARDLNVASSASSALVTASRSSCALAAAAREAAALNLTPLILGSAQGDARALGAEHARLALVCAAGKGLARPPCVLLSGGETAVAGSGGVGRSYEYLLSLAQTLAGHPGIWALTCEVDGADAPEENAAAIVGPHTLAEASWVGRSVSQALAENDSYGLFAAIDSLVMIDPMFTGGPMSTGVNDFRAILIESSSCG